MSFDYPPNTKEWRLVEVYGIDFRSNLLDMAQTITRLGLWNWFKDECSSGGEGYMFWSHPNIQKISAHLENNDHSGATFQFCVSQMYCIAIKGFASWNSLTTVAGARSNND
jgi:hypothetical protein